MLLSFLLPSLPFFLFFPFKSHEFIDFIKNYVNINNSGIREKEEETKIRWWSFQISL